MDIHVILFESEFPIAADSTVYEWNIAAGSCTRTTTHYCFSNRDVPSRFQLKEWTVSRVSLAVITGTGKGIVEIIGLSHQNTTCETLGGYYVARSIERNRAL